MTHHSLRMEWQVIKYSSPTLPLTPPKAQAQELADYFKSLPADQQPTAIYSSPYCMSTNQTRQRPFVNRDSIQTGAFKLPPQLLPRLASHFTLNTVRVYLVFSFGCSAFPAQS